MPVYFIRAGEDGPVKIGTAVSVEGRIRELQCGNHLDLCLLRVIEGGRNEETALHRRYENLWCRGEWFEFTQDMLTVEPSDLAEEPTKKCPRKSSDLDHVFKAAGGRRAIAKRFGIKVPSTYSWKRIPAERVAAVSEMTGIPPERLRPDLAAIFVAN